MKTTVVASQSTAQTALSTPALVVDLDVFEANIAAMADLLRGTGKTIRPHVKTHRTPELARRQLGGAAVGVTCATVGEAEAMVGAGIDDVFVANEVVDPRKIARLVALADRARIAVAVDDPEPVALLSVAGDPGRRDDRRPDRRRHPPPSVRRGDRAATPSASPRRSTAPPGLRLRGIMGYEGRIRLGEDDRPGKIIRAYGTLADDPPGPDRRRASRSRSCRRPARRRSPRPSPTR